MTSSEFEKAVPPPKRSRFAFLKTLAATHVLTPQRHTNVATNINPMGDAVNGSGPYNGGNGGITGGSSDNSTVGNDGSNSTGTDDGKGDHGSGNNNTNTDNGSNNNNNTNIDNGSSNNNTSSDGEDSNNSTTPWKPDNSTSIAAGAPLRIMCLGASVVKGETSPDQNGFRKTFRDDLSELGAPINMVGTQRYGDMPDNDHEAYGGRRVLQILDHAKKIVPKTQPNVFVINVGTNNVLQDRDVELVGQHMEMLIDYLLKTSPRSTVVLSTLLTNTVPNREPMILDVNEQIRDTFTKYEKKPVVLVELHPSEGGDDVPQVEDIGPDGSHPLEQGYEIMGHLLAKGVMAADEKSFLRWPEDGEPYDGNAGRIDAD
ncbi:SGNH hydrolase-type esterase domain-containing protein [Astrocystis sublimbata]|nr:SGNH hydrolase-type esterase domain-containing protein [Astrocystis sublimbata]